MEQIKMIGLDLDGTLLNEKKELLPYTRQVLEKAIAQGIIVLVATGRPCSGIPEEVRAIQGMRYALTMNGARIYDLAQGNTLINHPLPYEAARKALEITKKYDTLQEAYIGEEVFSEEKGLRNLSKYHRNPHMWDYVRATRTPVSSMLEWYTKTQKDADKLQLLFADMDARTAAWRELEQVPELVLSGSLGNNIEINAAGVNKGVGMLELGKLLGIRREEIMACGDSDNDLDMLREVGLGVAMGNAGETVKAVADYVTETNEEEGVAKAVERFALRGGKTC